MPGKGGTSRLRRSVSLAVEWAVSLGVLGILGVSGVFGSLT